MGICPVSSGGRGEVGVKRVVEGDGGGS